MRETLNVELRRKRMSYAVSVALATLIAGNSAFAQDSKAANGGDGEIATVMIVGARASQQSAIDRKKNAATAMDSIIAEDVGAFPDRNVGEAISRIAGVALDRGDFGEGVSVSVRGNGPDLTRVEIDGQGVQAGGGTDMNLGGSGRGVELREMSSDLIKSVDVVKGSTADMTEGSLGGGIIIKTRNGLDFKKQYFSARISAAQNSLNKTWTPNLNLIFADKFLDGRLGIIANLGKSRAANEYHSAQNNTSGTAGYARLLDFDNSPEKTFAFNPATVDPTATSPMLQSPLTGGGTFNSASPLDIVTKSGAAATKADCYTAFPALSATQQSAISGSTARATAINQRSNELLTCLNQWNDYTPSLVRYVVKHQDDQRTSGDVRLDFKVNNQLSVYGKISMTNRTVNDNFLTYGLGGLNVNPGSALAADGVTFVPTYTDANGKRTASPNTSYMLFPGTASFVNGAAPVQGAVANVVPGSYTVDSTHHVTKMGLTDNSAGTDQIYNVIKTQSDYFSAGGSYKNGPLKLEFLVGDARSKFQRGDMRTSWSYNYGPANMALLPNGVWGFDFPLNNLNQTDAARYSVLHPAATPTKAVAASINGPAVPAYTVAQQPLTTQSIGTQFSPQMAQSEEKTAKLDLSYAFSDRVPFLQYFKTGFNLRDTGSTNWGNGGYTVSPASGTFGKAGYVAPVVMPNSRVRGNIVGCTNTPGSLGAGGAPCQYGYVARTGLSDVKSGTSTLTQAQYQDMISQSMQQGPWAQFFGGAKNRPAGLLDGWNQIDVRKAFELAGVQNLNFDCVKTCTASDGNVYSQPFNKFDEKTYAGYMMTDFDLTHLPFTDKVLPFGMELSGNFGYRYVYTKVNGSALMNFVSVTKNASYNAADPFAANGVDTSTLSRPTTLAKNTTDIMPIFNLALWAVPDTLVLRYNRAKTIARPSIYSLLPAGTCTYDVRYEEGLSSTGNPQDQRCTGTIGNPALKPWTNINENLSLEWYVNKDTMFTAATFRQKGIIGPAHSVGHDDNLLFAGSGAVDPATGKPLGDAKFSYTTLENGPATTRTGVEVGTKTAFTFLPSILRYTGLDANYTKVKSSNNTITVVDLFTGETLAPVGEPRYSYNWSLWYDDGAFSARVAVQAVAEKFLCIAACFGNTVNNYPANGVIRTTVLPFNPGSPNYTGATRFIDAKMAYKFKNGVELFAEARNLGRAEGDQTQGRFVRYENGTPSVNLRGYSGRSILIGMNIRH